jgi:hypothetical protein
MNLGLLARFPPRVRSALLFVLGFIFSSAAGLLYLNNAWSAPLPAYHASRTIPNTDVNPFAANFFLEREVEAWKLERTVQMARDAGIGWARQEFIWAELEPEPGIFNWTKYDGIVDLLRRNHIRVIARLDRPPAWARSRASATGSSGPPDDIEAYGSFVREFTAHYRDKIDHLQIWNEPNLGREWNDAPIDPSAYTALLKTAYLNAKAANPDVQILSAPLAITLGESFTPNSPQYRNMNDLQFLEEMYAAGAKDYFDILSANAFGLGSPPDDPPNPGKLNFQRVLLQREVMDKFHDSDKAVWILEYGWNAAPESIPDSRLIWGRVSDSQQAEYTVRGIEISREWDWAGVVCIWFFRQVGDIPPGNPESYFRMVDVDFTPRPVYFAVKSATSALRLAQPGEYQESHPAIVFSEEWVHHLDAQANAGEYASTSAPAATATIRFFGETLDVVMRQQAGAGRLFVTIDGQPVNGLSRSEDGRSFVEGAGSGDTWRAVVPVARNLARGEHIAEFRADGDVNLDGFRIAPLAAPGPPWIPILVLAALGLILFALAIVNLRATQEAGK